MRLQQGLAGVRKDFQKKTKELDRIFERGLVIDGFSYMHLDLDSGLNLKRVDRS